jgi:small subunit ribosomal protein S10
MEKIRIRLQSFDHRLLDQSVKDIVTKAKRTGAKIAGPVPFGLRMSIRNRANISRCAFIND